MGQEYKGIAFTRRVVFGDQKRVHEFRCIWDQIFEFAINAV